MTKRIDAKTAVHVIFNEMYGIRMYYYYSVCLKCSFRWGFLAAKMDSDSYLEGGYKTKAQSLHACPCINSSPTGGILC